MCAQALQLERVGVWLLEGDELVSVTQYTHSTGEYTSGQRVTREVCPRYFDALHERRAIVAHDALTDPITRELVDDYLVPLGIGAMLDAPIYRRGDVVGVVCHEHVGPPRTWSQADIDFASSVADMLSIIFEQADSLLLEAELRTRAARLSDQDRLQTLMRLAGSVAHDFNSVLTAIALVGSGLARSKAPEVAGQAETLADAVQLGTRLVQQLGGVGELSAEDQPIADVRRCLEKLQRVIEPVVRNRAALEVSVDMTEPRAALPSLQLIQLLMNLCLNAADAMDQPGTISVRVRVPKSEEGPSTNLVLEVSDTGRGIPPEIRENIFNPYFTTKPTGTGLGLATVHSIVTDHGGRILVDSQPGRGTVFRVILPRA